MNVHRAIQDARPRVDLRRLLDDVAMRSTRIAIEIDPRVEQSIAATVTTDRHGSSQATLTRYGVDSASQALEAALVDAACWVNAQAPKRTIEVRRDDVDSLAKLARALSALVAESDPVLSAYALAAAQAVEP